MEANHGYVSIGLVNQSSKLACAGDALAAMLVSALAQLLAQTQGFGFPTERTSIKGDHHSPCPSKPLDAGGEDDDDDDEEGDGDFGEGEEDLSSEDGGDLDNNTNNSH
ncbi:hypothetical protein RJ639_046192 [Escallonia herrerae]|uniref:Uncharacterized protein n=1 Tax=Escallonia herrerae TaxID=1293975 RepID=A0AA88W7V2_9ASTE|nr:hypothetical protein RJ639_046192 [Escallonia herrerae]